MLIGLFSPVDSSFSYVDRSLFITQTYSCSWIHRRTKKPRIEARGHVSRHSSSHERKSRGTEKGEDANIRTETYEYVKRDLWTYEKLMLRSNVSVCSCVLLHLNGKGMHPVTRCNINLQHAATSYTSHCNTLQRRCSCVRMRRQLTLQHAATSCYNTLQHLTASYCNTGAVAFE